MAKQGTIITYQYPITGGGIGCKTAANSGTNQDLAKTTFSWTVVNQSIVDNTSTINWTLKVENLGKYDLSALDVDEFYIYNRTGGSSTRLYFTGTKVSVLSNSTAYSGSFTIAHNTDGSLSFPIKIQAYMKATTATGLNYSSSYALETESTITLDNITRKAVITSAPNFYDEQSPTILLAIPSVATSVQVGISFTGEEMNIPYRTINKTSTGYTFNFTNVEYNTLVSYLRSSGVVTDDGLAAPVRFYVLTDGSKIDYVTRTATLIDYKPFLEPVITVDDTSKTLTGSDQTIIKYITKASYNVNALGRKGASITSYAIKNGDLTLGTATGTFDEATSGDFYFTVTDNYEQTSGRLLELNFVNYTKLTCSAKVGDMTAEGKVSVTISGKYFNSTFGAVQNTLSLYYQVTKKNGTSKTTDWHVITPTISGDNYSYTFPIEGLEYLSVYDLHIEVKDKAMPSPAQAEVILASEPIFDWGRNDFNFNVPVSFNGVPMVDFVVENGVDGNWTYRKWNSGLMECWGFIKGTVDVTTQWGGVYRSNTTIQDYFPVSFVNYPIVQATPSYDNYGNYWLATFSTQSGMNRTPSYQICLGENAVNVNYKISFYAIGK
jgi:hypothetical protein